MLAWKRLLCVSLLLFACLISSFSLPSAAESDISSVPPVLEPVSLEATTDTQPEVTAPEVNLPVRRGLPAPLESPPFPSGEWQIGGTPMIGVPDTSDTYALMDSIKKTEFGRYLNRHRIKLYGWVDVGANISSSSRSNQPAAYAIYSNQVHLDQLLFRVERLPDTVQQDHIDWGFHLSNIYGIDYRYTNTKGIFSGQKTRNRRYGYDPILAYIDIYFPKIARGATLRVGRYLSIPDIEGQLAPDNYMFTHSLLYTFDTFTQQGGILTVKLNDQWQVQGGLAVGNDVSFWTNGRKLTGIAGVQWISKNNRDSIYLVANSINDARYAINNVQQNNITWSHHFRAFHDRWHTKTEAYYIWLHHVPATVLPSNVSPGFTNAYGAVNYLVGRINSKAYVTFRNEILNDQQGQRTGVATAYTSHGIGVTYWLNKSMAIRPEFRYERSYATRAYNQGTKKDQFMGAVDLIVRF